MQKPKAKDKYNFLYLEGERINSAMEFDQIAEKLFKKPVDKGTKENKKRLL